MQWNFGKKTLQFLLFKYRQSVQTEAASNAAVHALAPKCGDLIFSEGCCHEKLSAECRHAMLAHQRNGRLNPDFAAEWDALFNSDAMIQVQVDRFLAILTSVRSDLVRLFGDRQPSAIEIKWALDTKTQQGSFPKDTDIARYRERAAHLSPAERRAQLHNIVSFYSATCHGLLADGVRYDCEVNPPSWLERFDRLCTPHGVAPEEPLLFDLLQLSMIRSMESSNRGGAYQALTLQRRATIILGCGSIGGRRIC